MGDFRTSRNGSEREQLDLDILGALAARAQRTRMFGASAIDPVAVVVTVDTMWS